MTGVVLGAKFWLISIFGSPTPIADQWDAEAAFLFKPYVEGTLHIGALLAPHGEHRILWSRLLFLALLELNGRWDPIIEMTVNALLHVSALIILVLMLGASLGRIERLVLAVATAILFALPFGWENTLFGMQCQVYFLFLFSLACFHYGVDAPVFSLRWWGALAFAVGAYFAMASGALTLAALIIVHSLQAVVRRRTGWREYAAIVLGIAIVVLMLSAIPMPDIHAPFRAHSASQFASSFFQAMGWPPSAVTQLKPLADWGLPLNLVSAVFVNIPVLAFAWTHVRRLSVADRSVWIYLLIGIWTAMQAASIAYGRAVGVLWPRYLDILMIGIILNVACLLTLLQQNVGQPTKRAAAAWAIAMVATVIVGSAFLPRQFAALWQHRQQQTINTSAFLATGDQAHLSNKPIPYPSADRLASLASDPSIRSILPKDIMPTAELATHNPNLLLGAPLHGLFCALRTVLTVLGLFCFMAGSLVFAGAGYTLYSAFGRRQAHR
jgi:hypothetical protein